MSFCRQQVLGPVAAALLAALVILATPAQAQSLSPDEPPRAAPTTPVSTVPSAVDGQSSDAAPDLRPSEMPRYAVMADGPPAPSPAPPQSAPAAPNESGFKPPHYSVMQGLSARGGAAASAGVGDVYKLGTGDKVRVTVYGETDLSGEFDVDSSGAVRLPLIGQVAAAGLTVHDFEQRVTAKLAGRYLLNPQVSVEITAYRPFFIIGEVNKPGQYAFVNAMNVVTAVALAGGYTYRADDEDVYIRRNGGSREVERPADETTKIYPGDIIRIGERFF